MNVYELTLIILIKYIELYMNSKESSVLIIFKILLKPNLNIQMADTQIKAEYFVLHGFIIFLVVIKVIIGKLYT
jgi:hypothetical protein